MEQKIKYSHSHIINILEHTSKFLILLIFPVLRALFSTKVGFYGWLKGAWFDIATIAVIVGLGIWAWARYSYCFGDDGIYIHKGIVLPKERFIPYRKLCVLSIEEPFLFKPIGAVRICADTDGGMPTTPDFEITVNKNTLALIREKIANEIINESEIKRVYLPKNFYIAVLSFVVSNTLTGVIFVSTFLSGAGNVLGKEVENEMMGKLTMIMQKLAFGIPPLAAMLAFVILGGWGVSFLINLVRHWFFSATRQSGGLNIKSGLLTKREYFLTVKRINLIELRQTFITKLFGIYTAFVHCNGYGKKKDELSILMPAGSRSDLRQTMKLLLPEIPICARMVKPHIRYLSRFMIPPLSWIGGVLVAWIAAYYFFPQFDDVTFFIGLMAEIPCVWYLGVKILSYRHTGVGLTDGVYTFSYTYCYRIKTVAVPQRRIIKLTIRRSVFQVMSGCCDLVILTYSEGQKRHVVPNLNYDEARKIMKAEYE